MTLPPYNNQEVTVRQSDIGVAAVLELLAEGLIWPPEQSNGALIHRCAMCAACRRQKQLQEQPKEQDRKQRRRVSIFHLSMQIIGRKSGRSSTAAAAYRAGVRIVDERTGEVHDYTPKGRSNVRDKFILAPEYAPAWMRDRSALWNAVERIEKRKDAQLCREFEVSLPHELPEQERRRLLVEFVETEFVSLGMVADVAMHKPGKEGDRRNEHGHVLLTMRDIVGDGFGNKNRDWNRWNDADHIETWRSRWAHRVNLALEAHGISGRIDHRSYMRQALASGDDVLLANLPTVHLGPKASAMERHGDVTVPGNLNREVKAFNLEAERLRRAIREDANQSVAPEQSITPSKSRMPNRKDQLRVQLQDVLGLPNPPSTAEARDAVRKRRDELLTIPSQRINQSGAYTAASRRAYVAMKDMKALGQRRDELQARGRKLQAQAKQNLEAMRWRQTHPVRAWLHDLGIVTLPIATVSGSQDELRRAWDQARKEDEQLRLRLEAAQREQRETSSLRKQLQAEIWQEANAEVREMAARLDQAELLLADLQRIVEAEQRTWKLEALPIARQPDTDHDAVPTRRPTP